MNNLTEIYQTLKALGLCRDQTEFSRHWLGRSGTYLSYLGSSGRQPHLASLGMLTAQLHVVTMKSTDRSERAQLRSAWAAAMTMLQGERELLYGRSWERVTALVSPPSSQDR